MEMASYNRLCTVQKRRIQIKELPTLTQLHVLIYLFIYLII